MALDELPNGIVLRIIQYIAPEDIEAFSMTNQRIRTLSSARLARHRTLREQYSTVLLTSSVDGGMTHPIKLLYDISKDALVAQYVKYITFVNEDKYSSRDFTFDATHIDEEIWDIIRRFDVEKFIQDSPYFSHPANHLHLKSCLEGIQAGKQSDAFFLLLVSLTKLERLRFTKPRWDKAMLASILASGAVSNLAVVESYHWDTEGESPIDSLALFALAPSVRTLRGTANPYFPAATIAGDAEMFSSIPGWVTAVSHVECIELCAGGVESSALGPLLSPMRSLKEFRYCHYSDSLGGEPFEIRTWVDLLAQSVGSTLEVLSLTNPEGANTTVKSFHAFPKLRELEIEVQALVPDEDDDDSSIDSDSDTLKEGFHQPNDEEVVIPRLVDILPPSIEKVTLLIGGHEEETCDLLRDIATEKHRLPNLAKLTYGGRTLDQAVKDELKSAGITIGRKKNPFTPKHVEFWRDNPPSSC